MMDIFQLTNNFLSSLSLFSRHFTTKKCPFKGIFGKSNEEIPINHGTHDKSRQFGSGR